MSQYLNLIALSAVMFSVTSCDFFGCKKAEQAAPAATEQAAPVEHKDESTPLAANEVDAALGNSEEAATLAMHEGVSADNVVVDASEAATLAQHEPAMPMNDVKNEVPA